MTYLFQVTLGKNTSLQLLTFLQSFLKYGFQYIAKCHSASSSQECLGIIVDNMGMKPSSSKSEALASMPVTAHIEQLRSFLVPTGYPRNFVQDLSIIAAALTDLLPNKVFYLNRSHKMPIEWGYKYQISFNLLKISLANPLVPAFSS